MRKGDQLRLRDVRDAYRLIGDCRDLGGEPELWQTRMFAGLCQLIGATVGTGGEGCGDDRRILSSHSQRSRSGWTRGDASGSWPTSGRTGRSVTRSSGPWLRCAAEFLSGAIGSHLGRGVVWFARFQ